MSTLVVSRVPAVAITAWPRQKSQVSKSHSEEGCLRLIFVSFNPDIVRCENRQLKSKEQKNLLNINKEEADGGNDKASEALPEDLNGGVDFLFSQRTENKSLSGLS